MGSPIFQPFPMLSGRAAQTWRHQPSFYRPRHFHAEPEINVVMKGIARLSVGERVLTLAAGELVTFEPGQDHMLLEASPDLELIVMAMRPELAARVQGGRPLVFKGKVALAEPELEPFWAQVLALGEVRDAVAVESTIGDMFSALGNRTPDSDAVSRRAVGYLRMTPSVRGAELGHRLRTTPSHLSREFHRDLGVTLVEYRARLKLMRFIALVDSGLSLSAAAFDADFGSYAQCHRVFHRALGCGPRQYFGGARAEIEAATEPASVRGTPSESPPNEVACLF